MRLFTLLMFLCLQATAQQYNLKDGHADIKFNPHKPQVESKLTVFSYLQLYGMDTVNVYYVKDTLLGQVVNKACHNGALIFNKKGEMLRYSLRSASCNDPTNTFYMLSKSTTRYPVDSAYTLAEAMSAIAPYGKTQVDEGAEYTVVIYWKKFSGYYNALERIKGWYETIAENKNVKMNILLVSLDVHESWPDVHKEKWLRAYINLYEAMPQS